MNVGTQQMQKHNKLRNILFPTRRREGNNGSGGMTQTRTTTRYAKKKNYSIVPWGTSAMS